MNLGQLRAATAQDRDALLRLWGRLFDIEDSEDAAWHEELALRHDSFGT